MSRAKSVTPPEMDRLELTIRRVLEAHETVRRRLHKAEGRVRELESTVHGLATGRFDPVALEERVRQLEAANAELRDRLARAHAAVERMKSRLHFAEEER